MNDQIIQKKKWEYQKRQSITDRSFVFTKELLTRLDYQGNGIASRKLNHSSTKVTKDHYIVPNDKALEIENVYESNVASIERFKKVK